MGRLLKHKDTPEPGRWRTVTGDQARQWREEARGRIASGKSAMLEYDPVRQLGLDVAPGTSEQGEIETPRRENPREPRDTVEEMARIQLEWVLDGSREQVLHRVAILKRSAGWTHLTDDEALRQLRELAFKLARRDAERRYDELGLLRNGVAAGVSLRAGA